MHVFKIFNMGLFINIRNFQVRPLRMEDAEKRELEDDSVPEIRSSMDRTEILKALEIVERDSAAIAESFVSLFSALRPALSEVSATPT